MTLVVRSDKCRLCGRVLKDQSDLWAGRCNNDDACEKRLRARDEVDVEKIVIERDALRETVRTLKERVVDLEQRLIDEIERYRRALAHIADTCIQDPDTAQFAARVLDGSADVKEKP
jgi:hypothetical protein